MKNTIDHAILIPVSATAVWSVIGNIEANPKWQVNCKSVSYLNALRGQGMRWRYKDANGREVVAEVTAWYERLGFEYHLVDGTSFESNKGRIRLQETPDGTVVQWAFTYELGGFIGGIRNALGAKRSLDNTIVESLRVLYRYAKDSFNEVDPVSVKATMKDALNYEDRVNYKPRYGTGTTSADETNPKPLPLPVNQPKPDENAIYARPVSIVEPPPKDDDTRPNLATGEVAKIEQPAPLSFSSALTPDEPSFLKKVSEIPAVVQPSTPVPAPTLPLEPATPPIVLTTPETVAEELPKHALSAPQESAPVVTDVPAIPEPTKPIMPLDKRDTATINVFDLFGIPKPSETQEMRSVREAEITANIEAVLAIPSESISPTVITDEVPQLTTDEVKAVEVAIEESKKTRETLEINVVLVPDVTPFVPNRVGLRWILRSRLIRLRYPKNLP